MAGKRTRSASEAAREVAMRPVEISPLVRARNRVVRSARMTRVPPAPPPSPQRQRPTPQIKFTEEGGSRILPPTFVDLCNYCRKTIGPNEQRYMNGGLEAYCSPTCRENSNNMMEENVEPSVVLGLPSMSHTDPMEEDDELMGRSRN